jgi:hypothetical protein
MSVKTFVVLTSILTASLPVHATIHTVFTTECGPYFTWQSLGKTIIGKWVNQELYMQGSYLIVDAALVPRGNPSLFCRRIYVELQADRPRRECNAAYEL